MKTLYERMSREERLELYKEYKKEKASFSKKMEKMFMLCYLGIGYALIVFIYDFFYKKSTVGYILDIIVFVFCLIALFKLFSIKKELLNNFALKKDKEKKQNIVKKLKNKKN